MMTPRPGRLTLFATSALFSLMVLACDNKDKAQKEPRPPPPPTEIAKAGACAGGGGQVADPVSASYFPRVSGGYCVDPQGETKTYGDKGKLTMDEVCTTAFDGECEVYKRFGLTRVVSFRYVDGSGKGGSVEVYLSQFATTPGGYGMYTKRVIADGDPADPSAPKPLAAGGGGAIGTGRAYVWKGPYLVELQYINEQESPEQLAKSSDPLLSAIGKEIGAKLPGTPDKPAAAKALPEAELLPNGIQFFPKDPLGLTSVGAGAVGFYKDGEKRYRLLSILRDDADQAKDTMKTIRSRAGSLPVSGVGDEATHVVLGEGVGKSEYVIARKGAAVAGVGDEELAGKPGDPPSMVKATRLTKDEKIAKLRAWLASGQGAAPSPSGSGSSAPRPSGSAGGSAPPFGGQRNAVPGPLK